MVKEFTILPLLYFTTYHHRIVLYWLSREMEDELITQILEGCNRESCCYLFIAKLIESQAVIILSLILVQIYIFFWYCWICAGEECLYRGSSFEWNAVLVNYCVENINDSCSFVFGSLIMDLSKRSKTRCTYYILQYLEK